MKQFFSRYSYDSMRMFLDQFAISLFGFCLALTAVQMENDTLLLVFSLASILFYLALIYGVAQRVGAKDRTSVELGKLPFRPFIGALISLLANSLNLVLAGVVTLLSLLPGGNAGMARFAAMFLNGMYQGVYTLIKVGSISLNNCWWAYFLLPLPALLVSTVGYIAGVKDWHLTGLSHRSCLPPTVLRARSFVNASRKLPARRRKSRRATAWTRTVRTLIESGSAVPLARRSFLSYLT